MTPSMVPTREFARRLRRSVRRTVLGQVVSVLCDCPTGSSGACTSACCWRRCPTTPRSRRPSSPSTTVFPPRTSPSTSRRSPGAGVLRTVKGARGGYRLARPPAEITVLDVVEAIDGDESAFRCTEIRRRGPLAMPAREYTKTVRHPPRVQPGRRGVAGRARADDDRRSLRRACSSDVPRRDARKGRPLAAGARALRPALQRLSGRRGAACRGWPCCGGPSGGASSSSCS